MIYTVTFNPAIDYVVHLEGGLRPGSLNRNAAEEYQFGGKGVNVSNVLKTLGYDSVTLGFVAGFLGDGLEQGLRDMGLTTRFVHVAQGMTRINVKVKAAEETEINGMGPVITADDMAQLYAQLDDIQPGDMLVLSGSIPKCLPDSTYAEILAHMEGRGVQIVVDAAGELLASVLRYRPFLIKPNHHELGDLFGRELRSDDELVACAKALQGRGGRNVLVSLAGDGALLLDETGGCHRVHCPSGTVRNSVGAGDAMVAGFLAGWLERGDYDYALWLGTAAGSATAFSLGLAAREDIERLL
ncbi:MAG: 1-phosphofructokinase [Clostridiales bacterium]|nr:1-phosphofructokinase [Clostridiales bacterium]